MSEEPRKPLDYATPSKHRDPYMKWVLFLLAMIFSVASLIDTGSNSSGGAAAGLWVAFALLYIHEQKDAPS